MGESVMRNTAANLLSWLLTSFVVLGAIILATTDARPSSASANGFWNNPIIRACCSEADAFYSDDYQIQPDGSVLAKVSGTTPYSSWGKSLIGKRFRVEHDKIRNVPNPMGRGLLFINRGGTPLCFVTGALI